MTQRPISSSRAHPPGAFMPPLPRCCSPSYGRTKDYKSGALVEKDLETAAFNVFIYGRMIGAAAEIDDNLNRGRNMDTRTPQEMWAFVVFGSEENVADVSPRERLGSHALFFRPPPSITASFDARRYTAATLRLSFRAMTVVFVFSRASDFSMRTSSFVHGRVRVIFFAISFPI
jgi:hypothetical protein